MSSVEQQLRDALRAMNASDPGAPERVEAALRAAHRAQQRKRPWMYAVPLAAAAALTVWLLPEEAPLAQPSRPRAPQAPAVAYVSPRVAKAPIAARRVVARAQPAPVVRTQEFGPLYPGSSALPLDRAQVVRVAIPRAALASAGFAVDAARLNERVRADVLMSEDGLIQGIRLVR